MLPVLLMIAIPSASYLAWRMRAEIAHGYYRLADYGTSLPLILAASIFVWLVIDAVAGLSGLSFYVGVLFLFPLVFIFLVLVWGGTLLIWALVIRGFRALFKAS